MNPEQGKYSMNTLNALSERERERERDRKREKEKRERKKMAPCTT